MSYNQHAVPGNELAADEAIIADPRAALTPAELVERKLQHLLEGLPRAVSQMQAGVPRDRARLQSTMLTRGYILRV